MQDTQTLSMQKVRPRKKGREPLEHEISPEDHSLRSSRAWTVLQEWITGKRDNRRQPLNLLDREQAPAYLRREFILSGYLVGGTLPQAAWHTCFAWNNETLNAWTMLPGVIFAFAGLLSARHHMPSELPVFWIFLLSSLLHAPFAIRLHLTIGTSEAARNLWRTLDIFFIFFCSVPRAAAMGWYVFPPPLQYWAYMGLAACVFSFNVYTCMVRRRVKDIPKASLPKAIAVSIASYSLPGLVAAWRQYQAEGYGCICQLYTLIVSCVIIGGLSYGWKLPERFAPGRFDYIGGPKTHASLNAGPPVADCSNKSRPVSNSQAC